VAKHRQPTTTKWRPYVTTGIALNAATLFAFTYATDSHVTIDSMLAASTSIFVDGTKSITGNEEGTPFLRMADSFGGAYDQTRLGKGGANVYVEYPRSLGPLTGFGDPTYNASEGMATDETVKAVRQALRDYKPGDTIYVVGYSQGAGAVVKAIPELEKPEFDGVDIQYVLASNPRRNDGGILTRLPAGVYLPFLGVSFGGGTTPQDPDAKVLQVTRQYDGVADAPNFLFNIVADVNAIMGFYYLHSGYYKDVDPKDPRAIVTHSADGRITDVLIPAKVGELPLTMPLLALGVPRSIVEALDPFLRAIIETGYIRPAVVPSQPVPFQLVPPPSRWLSDLESVATGATQTVQALTGTAPPPDPSAKDTAGQRVMTVAEKGPESGGQDLEDPLGTTDSKDLVVDDTKPVVVVDDTTTPVVHDTKTLTVVDDTKTVVDEDAKPVVVVDDVKPTTTATPAITPPAVKKAEPPRKPYGGWRPGDLLRKILHPKPKSGDTPPKSGPPSAPQPSAPASPPSADPSDGAPGADDNTSTAAAA
jgi:hypothetical protein